VLEELHCPCRVDVRVADPNCLAYQSHKLAEVGFSKPANGYGVGVTHASLVSPFIREYPATLVRCRYFTCALPTISWRTAQLCLRGARAAFTSGHDGPCERSGLARAR
jgi:hypothetical protein